MADLDLARMTPETRARVLDVYALGYTDGIAAGRQQLEDEWRGLMEVSAAVARQVAEAGPFDELERYRGRPDRAERHVALLRSRGVVA